MALSADITVSCPVVLRKKSTISPPMKKITVRLSPLSGSLATNVVTKVPTGVVSIRERFRNEAMSGTLSLISNTVTMTTTDDVIAGSPLSLATTVRLYSDTFSRSRACAVKILPSCSMENTSLSPASV